MWRKEEEKGGKRIPEMSDAFGHIDDKGKMCNVYHIHMKIHRVN